MKKPIFLLTLSILFGLTHAQSSFKMLEESDVPGIHILPVFTYTQSDALRYLGDYTDLFLEYGMQKLYATKVIRDRDTARLEIAILQSSPSAFGIFSIMVRQCAQYNPFGGFSCTGPYETSAAKGNLFIAARTRTGTRSGQALCLQLVSTMIDKNPQDQWYPPPFIQSQQAAPFTNTLKYIKGPAGLKRTLPNWLDMFSNIQFHMYTMNIGQQQDIGIIARISFPDRNALSSFISSSGISSMYNDTIPVRTIDNMYRSVFMLNDTHLLFLESNSPSIYVKQFVPPLPQSPLPFEDEVP